MPSVKEKPRRSESGKRKAKQPAERCPEVVWQVFCPLWEDVGGCLVTEPGNVNAPLAFVPDMNRGIREAAEICWKVADRPDAEILPEDAIDLRRFRQTGSYPAGLVGMTCTPLDREGNPIGEERPCHPGQTPVTPAADHQEHAPSPPDKDHFKGATDADLEYRWEILRRAMEANVPAGDPDRFKVGELVEQSEDANGDRNIPVNREQMLAALNYLLSLPLENAQRILGGWSPKVLTVDRPASAGSLNHWALHPVLVLRSRSHDHRHPFWQFDDVPDDDVYLLRLMIRAGAHKGQVLRTFDWMRFAIDHDWEKMIADLPHRDGKAGAQ